MADMYCLAARVDTNEETAYSDQFEKIQPRYPIVVHPKFEAEVKNS